MGSILASDSKALANAKRKDKQIIQPLPLWRLKCLKCSLNVTIGFLFGVYHWMWKVLVGVKPKS